ncbi:hypothetical protein [Actinoplanes siamensis]|uniref:Uncharacterized protein n=1 Tax=Actinoplanes siamensis TaxID=1223317 RepID=A0A919N444_9ACTN|nr:hypothetical protein [Actinoplanes siamensis]GIF04006.1 hypothetical protein Asi03nite_15440 [Actinoplanes siamensis]
MTAVGDWLAPAPARPAPSEPRISGLVALVAVLGGVLPILVMAVTWATRPQPVRRESSCADGSGYVVADRPGEKRYEPAVQCNAAGAANRVERAGTGRYRVTFGGIGRDGGLAEITPVTGDDRICTLPEWRPRGHDEQVEVTCFDRAGAAADSGFAVRYRYRGEGALAYLRLGDPGRNSQTIDDPYSHNSARGGVNSADREDIGSYVVYFGRQEGVSGGAAQVVAVGEAPAVCGVQRWSAYPDGRALAVRVRCRDGAGQPLDSRFAVSFAGAGHVVADRPAQARYAPAAGTVVTRIAVGRWRVQTPGRTGSVQVTAYDSAAVCVVGSISDLRIVCRGTSGKPVDTRFVLTTWR